MKNIELTKLNSNTYGFDLGYLDGTCYSLNYNDVVYDFTFTIEEQSTTNGIPYYDYTFAQNVKIRWLLNNNKSRLQVLDNNTIKTYELISVTNPGPDELAVKSELNQTSEILDTYVVEHQNFAQIVGEYVVKLFELNTEISKLKTENEELKTKLASLKLSYPGTSFYQGFDERVEFIGECHVARVCYYTYINTSCIIEIYINVSMIGSNEFLLIIVNTDKSLTYIRINPTNKYAYMNEITGRNVWNSFATGVAGFQLPSTTTIIASSTNNYEFDYVLRKSAVS